MTIENFNDKQKNVQRHKEAMAIIKKNLEEIESLISNTAMDGAEATKIQTKLNVIHHYAENMQSICLEYESLLGDIAHTTCISWPPRCQFEIDSE